MSLSVDELCTELEQEHNQYLHQQKNAEQVYHQCTGTMAFIKAKIDAIRRKEAESQAAEVNDAATMDSAEVPA